MYTAQQIFDKSATLLLKQNQRSQFTAEDEESFEGCAYRGPNGLMCAVGALIPDDLYDYEMEDKRIGSVLGSWPELEPHMLGQDMPEEDAVELLEKMQSIHDCQDPWEWKNKLTALAIKYGLSTAALKGEQV